MRTPQEVKEEFRSAGIEIKEWAENRGYPPRLVYQLLAGRSQGIRGLSHEIAVALGIKEGLDLKLSEGLFALEIEQRRNKK